MSVYEYRCHQCRHTFEVVEPITRHKEHAVRCPRCGGKEIERHWEGVNVVTSKKS